MNEDRNAALMMLIKRLEGDIDVASRYSLELTAKLLKMALLDTRMQVHTISEDELRSLSDFLGGMAHAEDTESESTPH